VAQHNPHDFPVAPEQLPAGNNCGIVVLKKIHLFLIPVYIIKRAF
jgi:hypothetical protein